ncbi:unnamed protein product, partial [Phyllotreta striolata]
YDGVAGLSPCTKSLKRSKEIARSKNVNSIRAPRVPFNFDKRGDCEIYVSMKIFEYLLNSRHQQQVISLVEKNLGTRKGSRIGNSGNHKELQVLSRLHHVP